MAAFPMTAALPGASAKHLDEFTSDLVAARVTVAHLARWARRYVLAKGPGDCGRPGALCTLETLPGGREACRLARDLAWLPLADDGEHTQRAPGTADEIALLYVNALRGASGAVFYCQRVQHVMGECWFTTPERPGEGLCARTLAAADLLAGAGRGVLERVSR